MSCDNPMEAATYIAWEEYYNQLTRLYRRARGRGSWPQQNKYYKVFQRIAKMCLQEKVNIRDYITSAFSLIEKNRRSITPQDFAKGETLTAYRQQLEWRQGGIPKSRWTTQYTHLQKLRQGAPDKFPTDQAALKLLDLPFEAWFRVLYAEPFDEELYSLYGELAWTQLYADRSLREYVRQQAFRNMAELERRIGRFEDSV